MQLEVLEAMTIFINVSRDIVLKNVSVSLHSRSWQCCADSGQLKFGEIRKFMEESENILSNDHDLFIKEVQEFITAEVKAILSWGMLLFS